MLSRIAIVADSCGSAATLAQLLELEGYSVSIYSHIIDLLHSATGTQPDIVVFDQNTWTVRERAMVLVLRERLHPRSTRFVLITSMVELGWKPPELIDAVVVRPYFPNDLLLALSGQTVASHSPFAARFA